MSSELAFQGQISFSKGGASIAKTFPNTLFDVSGTAAVQNEISVGTVDETLALGDISTIGWVYAKNLDATNYILLGADGTLYNNKLKPGEAMFVRWNGAAIHAKANTAACLMEYLLISD